MQLLPKSGTHLLYQVLCGTAQFVRWNDILSRTFVGERGGGSEQRRIETIARLFEFLDVTVKDSEISGRFGSTTMKPGESITFRQGRGGKANGWRSELSEQHKAALKPVAGQQLIDLGYESDLKW